MINTVFFFFPPPLTTPVKLSLLPQIIVAWIPLATAAMVTPAFFSSMVAIPTLMGRHLLANAQDWG